MLTDKWCACGREGVFLSSLSSVVILDWAALLRQSQWKAWLELMKYFSWYSELLICSDFVKSTTA